MFLTLPAATALAIISVVVVRVLYERGAFWPETTEITARALAVFALGLPAFVMIKVFTPGYFAREDTKTPMLFAGISVAVNIAHGAHALPAHSRSRYCHRGIHLGLGQCHVSLLHPPTPRPFFARSRRAGETCRASCSAAPSWRPRFSAASTFCRPYFQPEAGILLSGRRPDAPDGCRRDRLFRRRRADWRDEHACASRQSQAQAGGLNLCCAVTVSLTLDVPAQEFRRGPSRRRLKGWRRL